MRAGARFVVALLIVASTAMAVVAAPAATFSNPIVEAAPDTGSADPSVVLFRGYYYYCRALGDRAIGVARARRLQDIGAAPMVTVFRPGPDTDHGRELWAPELQRIRGRWYIYFAASDGVNAHHRMYALQAESDDPQGRYVLKGRVSDDSDRWAIDGVALELHGKLYFVWSGWPGGDRRFPAGSLHRGDARPVDDRRQATPDRRARARLGARRRCGARRARADRPPRQDAPRVLGRRELERRLLARPAHVSRRRSAPRELVAQAAASRLRQERRRLGPSASGTPASFARPTARKTGSSTTRPTARAPAGALARFAPSLSGGRTMAGPSSAGRSRSVVRSRRRPGRRALRSRQRQPARAQRPLVRVSPGCDETRAAGCWPACRRAARTPGRRAPTRR